MAWMSGFKALSTQKKGKSDLSERDLAEFAQGEFSFF